MCACAFVPTGARAVRDVWSCLLGGVARTDTISSFLHDSSNVNTKQAGHHFLFLFFFKGGNKILLSGHSNGSVENFVTHHKTRLHVTSV